MRRGFWLLLTPLLLLALLYASLPALASFFVVRWLESRGFDNPRLELEYPGYRKLRVPRLSLGQDQAGRRIELSAAAVEIGYDLPTLLFERHLSRIRIPQLELQIENTGQDTNAAAPVDLTAFLPAAWLALAPAEQIQVGQLQLDYQTPQQPVRRLSGNIDLHAGILTSRLQLFEDAIPRARADLTLTSDHVEMSLLQDNRPVYQVQGRFRPDAGRLLVEVEQRLSLAPAQAWQRRWLPLTPGLPALNGELTGNGQLSLPLELNLGAQDWWHQIDLEQRLTGILSLQPPAAPFGQLRLPLEARLQLKGTRLRLTVPAGTEAEVEKLAIASLSPTDANLHLLSPLTLEADLEAVPDSLQLAPLEIELVTEPLQQAEDTLALTPLHLRLDRIDATQPSVSGNLSLARLDWRAPDHAFKLEDLNSDFDLTLADNRLQLRLPEGGGARLDKLRIPPFEPLQVTLRLASPVEFSAGLENPAGTASLAPLRLTLTPATLQHPQGSLQLSPVRLRLDRIDLQRTAVAGRLGLDRIRWQQQDRAFPAASLSSDFSIEDGRLSSRFELALDDPALRLGGRASSQLTPFDGDLYWRASPMSLQQAERLWNRYYPPAPPELAVDDGRLHLEGSADWAPAGLALRIDQRVEQLSARWGAIRLEGVQWQARTLRHRDGRLEQAGTLQLPLLDIGFPIETITAPYRFSQLPRQAPELQLGPLQAQLLGGDLSADSVTINPLAPRLTTRVRLQQFQLAQLLALQQQPGLIGEGSLNGTLPLSYDEQGPRIEDGHIASEGSGRIQFEPEAGVAALGRSNQGLAMALQALRDFHYELLSVDLQYAPDGTARMHTRLKGYNPEWNGGRAVDFNINIEQNLLKLLQALQFTGKLTESIEKRYR